ncbi:glycosyltransferase family 2 protein [Stenotrophomonas sp. S41]|uniref:glycosyltransferase family 2 protein n=1 Tax=Stenotrophomonas sp. S41 TaxID=2767464 RepID=UPI001909AE16|nr:glycosyltransferase family 2 protein [Stenotrophomonas sp. S41]MBK0011439.1 glycosyltransferase family 2 protein [Stenotrophomonas sp. S41]
MITPARQAASPKVAVIIPCYRVTRHVLDVLARIDAGVTAIYCIDDACPDGSGTLIESSSHDPRVRVIFHPVNRGVGGAIKTGYRAAIADGMDILVKVDGDGQMDPGLLMDFVTPIAEGHADYCKGNRFWNLGHIRRMPRLRRFGNLMLSFMTKASSGYWQVFDPTNGYTAIHARVASHLPLESISNRYFFETDMLFRLNTVRAVVQDVAMDAHYADETSNLRISRILGEFAFKHIRNTLKRVGYNYFLRDLSIASLELIAGLCLLGFGGCFGLYHWISSAAADVATPVGTIMLVMVSLISGLQFLLAFIGFDIANAPRQVLHRSIQVNRPARPVD